MLYIFGDSFSVPDDHKHEIIGPTGPVKFHPLEKNWTRIVSESLIGSNNHVNDSIMGCSNEYIFHKLKEKEPLLKPGDCVIVQLTSYYREWFFEDKPHMANYMTTKFIPGLHITKEANEALEMYKRHLFSNHRCLIHYEAIIDAIDLRTKIYGEQGIRCLVLPGFHEIQGVNGIMFDASNFEFDCGKTSQAYYAKGDLRFNHFSEVNHKILADKVIKFFDTGETVDFTTEFKTSIYAEGDI